MARTRRGDPDIAAEARFVGRLLAAATNRADARWPAADVAPTARVS